MIALGNGMYVELTRTGSKGSALFLGAPLGKTLVLAIGMVGALRLLQLPWGAVTKTLSIFLPLQLATGILGLLLALGVEKRIPGPRTPKVPQKSTLRKKKRK